MKQPTIQEQAKYIVRLNRAARSSLDECLSPIVNERLRQEVRQIWCDTNPSLMNMLVEHIRFKLFGFQKQSQTKRTKTKRSKKYAKRSKTVPRRYNY